MVRIPGWWCVTKIKRISRCVHYERDKPIYADHLLCLSGHRAFDADAAGEVTPQTTRASGNVSGIIGDSFLVIALMFIY